MKDSEVSFLSEEINRRLLGMLDQLSADRRLLLYAAIRQEVQLDHFAREALKRGYTVAYPTVSRLTENDMDFYEIASLEELTPSKRYHIPEPAEREDKLILPREGDIILVPGAAFSRSGDRIGYGAGYYDVYFRRFKNLQKIGICYERQLMPQWPVDPFDIPMDYLITENEEIVCHEGFSNNM